MHVHCMGRRKSISITTIEVHMTFDRLPLVTQLGCTSLARQHGHLVYALDHADHAVIRSGWVIGCLDEIRGSYSPSMSPNLLSLQARKLQYRQAQKALRSWRSQFLPYQKIPKPQVKDRNSHLSFRAHQHSLKCHGCLGEHAEHQTESQIMDPHRIRYNRTHIHTFIIKYALSLHPLCLSSFGVQCITK